MEEQFGTTSLSTSKMATKIDGKALANVLLEELKGECQSFIEETGVTPGLAVVLVGDDPASALYVKNKESACSRIGMKSNVFRLSKDCDESTILKQVEEINNNGDFHGLIVQLPLPPHINENVVVQSISPLKDVDGLTSASMGSLLLGKPVFVPCTPLGIMEMLKRNNIQPKGKHSVVVGRSNLVGKPIANLLLQKSDNANGTVTVVHSQTEQLTKYTKDADLLIVAVGRPEFIKPEDVKDGCIIVDVGTNRIEDSTRKSGYRFVGDVDRQAYLKSSMYTPVPGGVGPLTVSMLLKNTLLAARRLIK